METARGEARPKSSSPPQMAAPPGGSDPGSPLVFSGSSQQDEALAKSFWNSATLQPPLESRLTPRRESVCSSGANSRKGSCAGAAGQRYLYADCREDALDERVGAQLSPRPVASPSWQASPSALAGSSQGREEERLLKAIEIKNSDVKEQYLEKAKKREEIIALLRKQREERIMKETVSHPHKPKIKTQESFSKLKIPESELEDQESVKALT